MPPRPERASFPRKSIEKPEATEGVVRAAGDLAETHALRGFDAVHLASALLMREAASEQNDGEDVVSFLGFDASLVGAAGRTMRVYELGS